MSSLVFNNNKIDDKKAEELIDICPFSAIERDDNGNVFANSACKLCKICVKKGPEGCVEFIEDDSATEKIDKSE